LTASSKILRAVSNLFFPQICYSCGSDLISSEQLLCLRCLHQLPYTKFEAMVGNAVEKIFWGRIPIQQAASIFYFTKDSIVERLLYQLKYRGRKEVGLYCGQLMGQALKSSGCFREIDLIIPLPLFRKKEHQRGFNQAALIGEGLSEVLSVPVSTDIVERVEATETQTHKNRVERWQNMQGRFLLKDSTAIQNKNVLLVDDVVTTGATLESCGQELLKVPNISLSILTLAYSSSKNV
jgi:ComF family protein